MRIIWNTAAAALLACCLAGCEVEDTNESTFGEGIDNVGEAADPKSPRDRGDVGVPIGEGLQVQPEDPAQRSRPVTDR